jgi:ADP-heptose:LPS heptosyltransferase
MDPVQYKIQYQSLLQRGDEAAWMRLARQTAFSFIDHCYYSDRYEPEYIELLCGMAMGLPDPAVNHVGTSVLFGIVIEELCDDYEDFQFETYSRVMAQVIDYCRRLPQGRLLDEHLTGFGLNHSEALLERIRRIHDASSIWKVQRTVEKIILLSRITLGADVAIVSVMVQRLLQAYPHADVLILGEKKLAELFAGHQRVRVHPVAYPRHGGLIQRFDAWHSLLAILKEEIPSDTPSASLLIDPDSRLSQLGMLPLGDDRNYLYFDSHDTSHNVRLMSMAELANKWLDTVLGPSEFCYPRVWPATDFLTQARNLLTTLRCHGCERIIAVNFGVGRNERKRLGTIVETELVRRLLEHPRTTVILDQGFGPEEVEAARTILSAVQASGKTVKEVRFDRPAEWTLAGGVLAVSCGIGQTAALIGGSDEFIGYDSACQHIAAALQIPAITIFAGTNSPRFIRRWKACSAAPNAIVHVNAFRHDGTPDPAEVVERIMQERSGKNRKPHRDTGI